ncbi:hypothetical protein COOONC_09181 [Cooperia oncophora]
MLECSILVRPLTYFLTQYVRQPFVEIVRPSNFNVHYIFHLQRRPIYYITVIVAPTFLISALSILGIFSPGSSDGPRNEKVSLGLGSLLAMTVLLGIVAGAMPKSNSIPLLGYYILIVILLCAIAVSISMAFLAISRQYIQKGDDYCTQNVHSRWVTLSDILLLPIYRVPGYLPEEHLQAV